MEPGPCFLFARGTRIKYMEFVEFKVAMLSQMTQNLSLPKFVYMIEILYSSSNDGVCLCW